MSRYKKPSEFNFVSILLLLVVILMGYGVIRFGPPYYRQFQVKGTLENCIAKFYPKRHMDAMYADQFLRDLQEEARNDIHQRIGVEDAGLIVRLLHNPETLTATAIYKEVIEHPFGIKPTTLQFEPTIVGKLK